MIVTARAAQWAVILVWWLAGIGSVAAQDARDSEAHGLYMAGEAAYEDGRFEDALRYFQQSYELSPRPQLLYNIGQAADRARMDDVALDALRRYLGSSVEIADEERRRIEARAQALEAAIARRTETVTTTEPEPEPTVAEPEPEPEPTVEPEPTTPSSGPDGAGLALLIAGGAVAVGGAILLGVGAPDTGALANPRDGETFGAAQSRQDTGSALVAAGIAGLGVGAGLAIIGAVILASAPGSAEHARVTANGLEVSF